MGLEPSIFFRLKAWSTPACSDAWRLLGQRARVLVVKAGGAAPSAYMLQYVGDRRACDVEASSAGTGNPEVRRAIPAVGGWSIWAEQALGRTIVAGHAAMARAMPTRLCRPVLPVQYHVELLR